MNEFLKKHGIIVHFSLQVPISKHDFVAQLRQHVDVGDTSFLSDAFDIFSRSENEFKGQVGVDRFRIKRRRKLFDPSAAFAVAEGSYRQEENHVVIDTEINGFRGFFKLFYVFITLFYAAFSGILILVSITGEAVPLFFLPLLFIHAAGMYVIPFFLMKRSVNKLKYELDREFFYMTKYVSDPGAQP